MVYTVTYKKTKNKIIPSFKQKNKINKLNININHIYIKLSFRKLISN